MFILEIDMEKLPLAREILNKVNVTFRVGNISEDGMKVNLTFKIQKLYDKASEALKDM